MAREVVTNGINRQVLPSSTFLPIKKKVQRTLAIYVNLKNCFEWLYNFSRGGRLNKGVRGIEQSTKVSYLW
jgi:hypothetical protein